MCKYIYATINTVYDFQKSILSPAYSNGFAYSNIIVAHCRTQSIRFDKNSFGRGRRSINR